MLCPGGGCGPSGSDGVAMPSEWSNDELSSEGDRDATAELRELEDELCRLAGVHAVRIVGDRSGRPVEVHVLADPSKPAKQTVRDVRAVAQTVFGIELDHRIVSVAQLNTNDQNTPVGIELPHGEARARVGSDQRRGRRPPRAGARRARRERPRAHRLRRGLDRRARHDRSSSPPPRSTRSARASPQRRPSTSPARRSAASAATASRSSPSSTSTRRPSSSCRARRSCVAIATTPWHARSSTPRTGGSLAPNADARSG